MQISSHNIGVLEKAPAVLQYFTDRPYRRTSVRTPVRTPNLARTMPSIYTATQRYALFTLPLLLLFATLLLSRHPHYSPKMNACYIYRESETPLPTWIPLRDGLLHNLSVYLMWAGMLLLALLPRARALGLFSLLYASVWFHATYVLLAALKAPLGDFNCAGRHARYPNGISGHYCYFLFVTLTVPAVAMPRLRANKQAARGALAAAGGLLAMYAVGAGATLYRTFAHGYHSMQQIFLGSALGIASHALLEAFVFSGMVHASVRMQMSVLVANSCVAFAMYYSWWPTEKAGPAITPAHVYFHALLYAGLFVTAMLLTEEETVKIAPVERKPEAAKA